MFGSDKIDVISWLAGTGLLLVGAYVGARDGGIGPAIVWGLIGALVGFALPALVYRFREVGIVALVFGGAIAAIYLGFRLWGAI